MWRDVKVKNWTRAAFFGQHGTQASMSLTRSSHSLPSTWNAVERTPQPGGADVEYFVLHTLKVTQKIYMQSKNA